MTPDQRSAEFVKALHGSLIQFVRACVCLREMVRNGEDISAIAPENRVLMEKIADGQLLVGLYMKMASKPGHWLRRLANYSTAEQQRLLQDGEVRRVVFIDGNPDIQRVPIQRLTDDDFRQVFATDHIRDEGEQRQWLLAESQKLGVPSPQDANIKFDRRGRAVIIGGVRVTLKQLSEYESILTK
jgi:hypothetical protein